jgi:ATP-binding cassette subfamily B protein
MISRTRAWLLPAYTQTRWAFATVRACCPGLLTYYGLSALMLTLVPAGIALSVRGLVNAVDQALDGVPLEHTDAYPWLILGFSATLAFALGNLLTRFLAQRMQLKLRTNLQESLLEALAARPFSLTEQPEFQNQLRRVQQAPELHVADLCTHTLELLTKSLQGLSLILILMLIEPLLFLFLLPIGIPYVLYRAHLSKRQFLERDRQIELERRAGYYTRILADVDQAAEIRLLDIGGELIRRWRSQADQIEQLQHRHQRQELRAGVVFAVFSVLAVYLAMAHTLQSIVFGHLSIGDLAIFGSAAAQLRSVVDQSANLIGGLRWKVMHVGRVRRFLEESADVVAGKSRQVASTATGFASVSHGAGIELRSVSFRYPGAPDPVLQDLSLSIPAGQTVALVGANGAGKSTFAKLIAGLYRADAGQVLIGGEDVTKLSSCELALRVGCVFQQLGRFQASAAENIAFGNWAMLQDDLAAVERIAKQAGVHAMIEAMPQGYQTPLGRQFGLYEPSGGQWQQLAIARLIARDAGVLILDEPTANLDVIAEAELFQRFQRLAAGRTTLLISHRFSTVAMADRILVIEHGRIIEDGSHRELLAHDGRYAALFRLSQRFSADLDA